MTTQHTLKHYFLVNKSTKYLILALFIDGIAIILATTKNILFIIPMIIAVAFALLAWHYSTKETVPDWVIKEMDG